MIENKTELLICLTPLHMLIALKIMELNPSNYDVLCISYNSNAKYKYYFDKLKSKCLNSNFFLINSTNKLKRLYDLVKFKYFIKTKLKNNYSKIYLASIDNSFFHLLLSILEKELIITFDDGSANINKNSDYYQYQRKSKFQNLLLSFLGNIYTTKKIISETSIHYTIYKDFDNISKKLKFIALFDDSGLIYTCDKVIKIYLGQPFGDLHFNKNEMIFQYLKNNGIKNYFPHPREKNIYDGFDYINTPLILEDYIVGLLNENYFVEIYTVVSTAALNVVSLPNVKVNVLYLEEFKNKFGDLYRIFRNMNCNISNI